MSVVIDKERREYMKELVEKVGQLHSALYMNGFSKKVSDLEGHMREVKEDVSEIKIAFAVFNAGRADTCPVRKTKKDERRELYTVIALCFSAVSSIAVIATLILNIAAG